MSDLQQNAKIFGLMSARIERNGKRTKRSASREEEKDTERQKM